MLTFIHDNFKLDITHFKVTLTEINQWFKDDFSTESSLPFDIILDEEMVKHTNFSTHYNANLNQTIYEGYLDKDGILVSAVLKFQEIKGKIISAVLNLGQDNFPSFDKKLSELPLEQKTVSSLVDNANSVLRKGYPDTNYNFGMVHTDKYDATTDDWRGFEGTINKHDGLTFIENQLDLGTNIDLIKNIIQPLPHLMHVVKSGIEAAGYTLEGDIMTDPDLNKALIFRDGNYYNRLSEEELPISYKNNEYDALAYQHNSFQYVTFSKLVTIEKKGDYILLGSLHTLVYSARKNPAWSHNRYQCSKYSIKIEKISGGITTVLATTDSSIFVGSGTTNLWAEVNDFSYDIPVSFEVGDILKITKTEPKRDYFPSITPDYPEAISLKLIPIRYRNPDGSPILSVQNLKEIDLTRCVPDMTFRELITIIKNWKNYSFDSVGNVIQMNRVAKQLSRSDAVDLSEFDIDEPLRIIHEDRVFELTFTDGKSNEKYKYDSMLISKSGTVVNNYTVKDSDSSIKIDALPLPVTTKTGITTAYSFEEASSKLRLVFMLPVPEGGIPNTFWNENMAIPAIHEAEYKDWLNFRIKSVGWNWDFIIPVEKMREITVRTLVYAYKNYHIFTDIEKERLNRLNLRVTAKTESLL
ncbi:MAG: hypothetical protein RLZZ540_267 [Bacteroidota bacterium]|jgi:hypothetical protein